MSNAALSVIEMTTRAIYARWQLTKLQTCIIIFSWRALLILSVMSNVTFSRHSTHFKNHLLSLLPESAEFSQDKEIYISNKTKVAELIAKAHDSHIGQDDALLLMRAAVI